MVAERIEIIKEDLNTHAAKTVAVNTFVTESTERKNHNKIDTKSKQQPSRRKVEYDDKLTVNRITFDIGVRTKNHSVSSDRREQYQTNSVHE
jgi:hypothetical protein